MISVGITVKVERWQNNIKLKSIWGDKKRRSNKIKIMMLKSVALSFQVFAIYYSFICLCSCRCVSVSVYIPMYLFARFILSGTWKTGTRKIFPNKLNWNAKNEIASIHIMQRGIHFCTIIFTWFNWAFVRF